MYSQTCVQRLPLGSKKCSLLGGGRYSEGQNFFNLKKFLYFEKKINLRDSEKQWHFEQPFAVQIFKLNTFSVEINCIF